MDEIEHIAYPKIPKLSLVEPLLEGRTVVVQPKLDGSNVAIRRVGDRIIYQSRTQILHPEKDNRGLFKGFLTWATERQLRCGFDRLPDGYILYGETLHNASKIRYDEASPFVLFDVYDALVGNWLTLGVVAKIANTFSLDYAEPLFVGTWGVDVGASMCASLLAETPSSFNGRRGNDPAAEGVVVKTYPAVGEDGIGPYQQRIVAGKLVTEEYKESKAPKTSLKQVEDPLAVIADTFVTPARFEKARTRLLEEGKNPDVQPHLLIGLVSKDIHDEEELEIKTMLWKAYWRGIGKHIAQRVLALHERMMVEEAA